MTTLREPGILASILIATVSAAFGALLLTTTQIIGDVLKATPEIGDSQTLHVVVAMLSVILTVVAMYVAAIVTDNTFATMVAGQTRAIALQRLLGSSAGRERTRFARRGLAIGTIGAVAGYALAMLVSAIATPLVSNALAVSLHPFTPAAVIPPLAVILTTWLAAVAGTRGVISVKPIQALVNSAPQPAPTKAPKLALTLLVTGTLLLVGGVIAGLVTPLAVIIAFIGGILSFTGLSLGSALFMPAVLRIVSKLFGGSAPATIAAASAERDAHRAGRTAIGVVMGVALVTMFAAAAETAKAVLYRSAGDDMMEPFAQAIDSFASIMMALVAVAAVVAAIGVVNLLTLGVIQRRRELGVLRALGFTNGQVRAMVLIEAAHVAIASLVTGLALGVFYGWAGAQATLGSIRVPPAQLGPGLIWPAIPLHVVAIVTAATIILTLIAAITPTRIATRTPPIVALAT